MYVAGAAGLLCGAGASALAQQSYPFFDDGQVALVAITNPGVQEQPVAVYLNGVRVNDPATGGADLFDIVEFYDRVPGTSSYPLTLADIVANGYVRPLVQRESGGGTTTAFGTSVITGPSFRPQFESLDLIPDITRADVTTGGVGRVVVQGAGIYSGPGGARASLVSRRQYPDPVLGATTFNVHMTWTAVQNITMPSVAAGRGNDAFRFIMLSSMLADIAGGEYDARYLMTTDPQGRRRTIALNEQVRNAHLFPSPRASGVGMPFALLKDNAATWNAGSPSIEIELTSISENVGQVGVQGYRLDSSDPNDDSLNVWLEWVGAPAVIAAGTVIEATFRVTATAATDPGDLDHDGDMDCDDVARLDGLIGRTLSSPDFDAYADLDFSGVINAADRSLLLARLDTFPADWDGSGAVTSADFFAFLSDFFSDEGDFDGNGVTNSADFFGFLAAFFGTCA